MKLNKLFGLLIAVILVSCMNKDENVPPNLIPRDKFVEVMVDVQLVESINQIKNDRNITDYNLDEAYLWIYRKHNIDSASLKASFDYYAHKPKELEEIYDEVITRISEREAEEKS